MSRSVKAMRKCLSFGTAGWNGEATAASQTSFKDIEKLNDLVDRRAADAML